MLIKRTKERSPEITPDNRGVIWGKELNGMATDEELYGQYLSGDETGLELLIKKYGDPLTLYIDGYLHDVHEAEDLMMETFSCCLRKSPASGMDVLRLISIKRRGTWLYATKADGGLSSVLTT